MGRHRVLYSLVSESRSLLTCRVAARQRRAAECCSRAPTPGRPREPNAGARDCRRAAAISTDSEKRACRSCSRNIGEIAKAPSPSRDCRRSRLARFPRQRSGAVTREEVHTRHLRERSFIAFSKPRSLSRNAASMAGMSSATGSSEP